MKALKQISTQLLIPFSGYLIHAISYGLVRVLFYPILAQVTTFSLREIIFCQSEISISMIKDISFRKLNHMKRIEKLCQKI